MQLSTNHLLEDSRELIADLVLEGGGQASPDRVWGCRHMVVSASQTPHAPTRLNRSAIACSVNVVGVVGWSGTRFVDASGIRSCMKSR